VNKLAIGICATKSYAYAVRAQAVAVQSAILEYIRVRKSPLELTIILASDYCEKMANLEPYYADLLNSTLIKLRIVHLKYNLDDNNKNYKTKAQKLIATLRTGVFNEAKKLGVDYIWSLDSDILPKANSLTSMEDALLFDDGYYSVACCVYPSQGGGAFLCGRGTEKHPIAQDVYPEEKKIHKKIQVRINQISKEIESKIALAKKTPNLQVFKDLQLLNKRKYLWSKYINKRAHPESRNPFVLNSKGWRKRGWFDVAYPAIGKGAMVPTDWCGFGCNLINQKALNYIDFHGYQGRGTEDLFIVWKRWFPNNIRLVAIPHCPADHIIRMRSKDKDTGAVLINYAHIMTYHENEGEFEGHLRQDRLEFHEYS